jgi:hypothetical protein
MRKEILKTLVIGTIFLLLCVAFQPVVSTNEMKNENVKPKEFLFETLIDIANDPEIKLLFEQVGNDWIDLDLDVKEYLLEVAFKKPRILTSVLFNRPSNSFDYFDFAFDQGKETVNIIGEEESLGLIRSLKINDCQVLDDVKNIILNNEDLNEKISRLQIMNSQLNSQTPFLNSPIICAILTSLTVYTVLIAVIIHYIGLQFFEGSPVFDLLMNFIINPLMNIALVYAGIADYFHCWDNWPQC